MNFKEFTFLTDENIHPDVVSYLRNNNYDVTDVKESGLTGKSDSFLIKFAFTEKRIILIHDSDFGKLVFLDSSEFIGIINLRPAHFLAKETISTL
jgi:predicted nuclease of predicted toxin-antitoxin system